MCSLELKDPKGIVCLPEGVWSRCRISGNDLRLDSGCVVAADKQRVVSRVYFDGKLQRVALQEIVRAASTPKQ